MFDRKEMCHVYSSEEGPNAHADLMQKYISKDFCTVDPIRNYDTSPDLQLDDPSQAVWRVSREKVAVVNTYNVLPNSTPHLPSRPGDDDDDEEADGSEQLSVKSSRTYHTKTGETKFTGMMNTPALTDKAQSPSRSVSPDARTRKSSPGRSPNKPSKQALQPQQAMYQHGLGITGGGFTPLMRGGEHFTPVLYPPQPPEQHTGYIWPSPNMMSQDEANMIASQQAAIRAQYLPSLGIPYGGQSQYVYDTPQTRYPPTPLPPQPILRPSPKKEQAHFNHYTYPPKEYEAPSMQQQASRPRSEREESEAPTPSDQPSPQYTYQEPVYERRPSSPKKDAAPRTMPQRKIDPPELLPERRVTRSQSRSPELKARQLPVPPAGMQVIHKSQIPMHLRGPSLLDEITFDPETGCAMMEANALNSWLNGAPLSNLSPGHSRETSHVRGESVSQWLNMPGIPE